RMVFVTRRTVPDPLQVEHVLNAAPFLAPVPLHGLQETFLLTLIFFSTPEAISSRVSLTRIRKLLPREPRRPPPEFDPPKKLSKGLPPAAPPKISPNWLNMSSMFMPPWPPPPNPPPPKPN